MTALNAKDVKSWFSTSELLEYLAISRNELDELFSLFSEGFHYRLLDPKDPHGELLWRIDRVDDLLCIPIPPLEKEAMLNAVKERITCKK